MNQNVPSVQIKRRHHIVPRFAISQFGCKHAEDFGVWTFPISAKRPGPLHLPYDSVAVRNFFYRVEVDGANQNIFEDSLGRVESLVAPIWKQAGKTQILPQGSDLNELLYFVALTFCRNPAYREIGDQTITGLANLQKKIMAQSDAYLEQQVRKIKLELNEDVTKDELKGILLNGKTKFVQTQAGYLFDLHKRIEEIYRALICRNWSLGIAGIGSGNFVFSDNPVGLSQTREIPFPFGVGFGVPGTQVTIPLSPKTILIGDFEKVPPMIELNTRGVSLANSATILNSSEVYSSSRTFSWFHPKDNLIRHSDKFNRDKSIFESSKRKVSFS